MRKFVAMVLAFLMLCTLLTGCEDVLSTPIIHGKESVPNPAYAKIFTDHNLIDRPHRFSDLDSAAFVKVYDIGLIEKLEFGYRSYFIEEVKELVNTLYFPITGMDKAQQEALAVEVEGMLAIYMELDFCSYKIGTGDSFYTVQLHFTDLNERANAKMLCELGLAGGGVGLGILSMKKTEEHLIANGYVPDTL